ncbi:hypothetical protein [Kitasatospora herbaricolor]|uniref:hypothetical protein n=1 Tax=Kitasatospora herbaricolor TaxID=68217 RepID=UPI0036DA42E3
MTTAHVTLHVSHSQYWISEINGFPDDFTSDMYTGFNGLISLPAVTLGSFAIVMTGTETGNISVDVDWTETEPPLDLDAWEEVVEVSMEFEEEPGLVFGPSGASSEVLPQLAPGWYRIRVHARGRDEGHTLRTVSDDPVEEHLITAWPAPPGPEIRHKLTDAYGAEIRTR